VAENFLVRHVKAKKPRSQYDFECILNNLVYPLWQDRPLEEIRRSEVADLLDAVENENGARQADVIIIRKMINWCATRADNIARPRCAACTAKASTSATASSAMTKFARCGSRAATWARSAPLLVTGRRCGKELTMKSD
jgi:hypothetical protein